MQGQHTARQSVHHVSCRCLQDNIADKILRQGLIELGITPVPVLRKIRGNPPQARITGEAKRRANVLGVYAVLPGADVAGKKIVLLDDILTTGATMGEAARVLLTAGAREVHGAAVAAVKK